MHDNTPKKIIVPWNKAVPRMPRKLNIAPYPYKTNSAKYIKRTVKQTKDKNNADKKKNHHMPYTTKYNLGQLNKIANTK
jgi:hypothetical protein